MAKTFNLRPKAVQDLEEIYSYSVKEWGARHPDRYIRDIEIAFQNLANTDTLGRDCSYIRPKLRIFPVVSHLIFYKSTACGIAVIRVLHNSMDEEQHL